MLTLQLGQSIVGALVLKETPCSICSLQSGTPHFEQLATEGFTFLALEPLIGILSLILLRKESDSTKIGQGKK